MAKIVRTEQYGQNGSTFRNRKWNRNAQSGDTQKGGMVRAGDYEGTNRAEALNLFGQGPQRGPDKMVYGQNDIGQNGMAKMVRTDWYGQNGSTFRNRL